MGEARLQVRSFRGIAMLGAVLCLAVAGCTNGDQWTRNRPKRVRVTGEVTYKGQPLADANVTFMNSAANRTASGMTDAAGRFVLGTFEQSDGAVPGPQEVSIRKVLIEFPGTKLEGMTIPQIQAEFAKMSDGEVLKISASQKTRWLIPERYGAFKTSKLTVDVVEEGQNHFQFEIKD